MRKLFLLHFLFLSCFAFSQSVKLTKEEKKQERKNIDSLFIVYSLPINIETVENFTNMELRDSVVEFLKIKKYQCPAPTTVKNLILEKMFDFLPSPVTEKERYKETMEKVAKDQSYYFQLMAMADPFMQRLEFSTKKNEAGINFIHVRRQNYPNVKKSRTWTFKYDEAEPVNNLATRIVETLTNTKQNQ